MAMWGRLRFRTFWMWRLSGAVFVISVNAKHFQSAGFAAQMGALGDQIHSLTLDDVRIYDDRADDAHRNDLARLMVFKKA